MRKVAIFGGSFNPPHLRHLDIACALAEYFDLILVIPCGPRPDKPMVSKIERVHRENLVRLAFQGLPKIRLELFDLGSRVFTRSHVLETIFKNEGEIWHVVGADLVQGGGKKQS